MERPANSDPKTGNAAQDSLSRLDERLAAVEAERNKPRPKIIGGEAGAGYRLLSQMLGGILGGVGLGWLVDHYAHTTPLGLVCGLSIGSVLTVYAVVKTAGSTSQTADRRRSPEPSGDQAAKTKSATTADGRERVEGR